MNRKMMTFASVGMVVLAVLATGCSGKKKHTTLATDTDTLSMDGAGTDSGAMSERGVNGERITDATFSNVLFGYNQFQIEQNEAAKIEAVAQYMQQNPATHLVAEGNCDERGTLEYNLALGENRAQAVRAYLISLGIEGSRIQTLSYGEEKPSDAGHTESAWSANRRVEFALYK